MMNNEQVRSKASDDPFKREHRYAVAKYKDMLTYMTEAQQHAFIELFKVIDAGRKASGKPGLECICIESDWPEYPVAWGMIEARMTGQTHGIATLEERRKDGMNGTRLDCSLAEVAELRAALATSAVPERSGKLADAGYLAPIKLAESTNSPGLWLDEQGTYYQLAYKVAAPADSSSAAPSEVDLRKTLWALRAERDATSGEMRKAYNAVCDRLDVLISRKGN